MDFGGSIKFGVIAVIIVVLQLSTFVSAQSASNSTWLTLNGNYLSYFNFLFFLFTTTTMLKFLFQNI